MRFLLTAEEFGAAEALRIGLMQEVVPAGGRVQRAADLVSRAWDDDGNGGSQRPLDRGGR